jgi:hypothetical protein
MLYQNEQKLSTDFSEKWSITFHAPPGAALFTF